MADSLVWRRTALASRGRVDAPAATYRRRYSWLLGVPLNLVRSDRDVRNVS